MDVAEVVAGRLRNGESLTFRSLADGYVFGNGDQVATQIVRDLIRNELARSAPRGRVVPTSPAEESSRRTSEREAADVRKRARLERWAAQVEGCKTRDELCAALTLIAGEAMTLSSLCE